MIVQKRFLKAYSLFHAMQYSFQNIGLLEP